MIERRGFLFGLGALLAAPAVVRSGILMPIAPPLIIHRVIVYNLFHDAYLARERWEKNGKIYNRDQLIASLRGEMPAGFSRSDYASKWLDIQKRLGTL